MSDSLYAEIRALAEELWALTVEDQGVARQLDAILACHPEAASPGITLEAVSRLLEEAEAIEAPLERWGYVRSRLERWSKGG